MIPHKLIRPRLLHIYCDVFLCINVNLYAANFVFMNILEPQNETINIPFEKITLLKK